MLLTSAQMEAASNLRSAYDDLDRASRALKGLPYSLVRKNIGRYSYLYEMTDRNGNGRSLGPWSEQAESELADYRRTKIELKCQRAAARSNLERASRMYRRTGLPLLENLVGEFFRNMQDRRIFDNDAKIVGRYFAAARSLSEFFVPSLPSDLKIELAWRQMSGSAFSRSVADALRAVDPTFILYSSYPVKARNSSGLELEILPWKGVEWLCPTSTIAVCWDGRLAPISAANVGEDS